MQKPPPTVSIILPVYNREAFLTDAINSIKSQTFLDWELVIVDDGSTDNTQSLLQTLVSTINQDVIFVTQSNQGPYAARNTGIVNSRGRYIAFYDSDDVWLSHHLEQCVSALDRHTEVDWVYGACEIIDLTSEKTVAHSSFYTHDKPKPFLSLKTETHESVNIIKDPRATEFQIKHGLYCGLQNSVIRRELLQNELFEHESRNEAEDQLFAIRSLAKGKVIAYFDRIHVLYRIHNANSSSAGSDHDIARKEKVTRTAICGFERMLRSGLLNKLQTRAMKQRLSNEYFWKLGYSILWSKRSRPRQALSPMLKGIRLAPQDLSKIKTFSLTVARAVMNWTPNN